MALYLRRAADQFPRAGWEPSNDHLAIMSRETVVGIWRGRWAAPLVPLVLVYHLRADRDHADDRPCSDARGGAG